MTYPEIGAIFVAVIASITDVRTGKIYNALTLPAAVVGIILNAVANGMSVPDDPVHAGLAGVMSGVFGLLLAMAIMLGLKFLLKMGQLGGGDIKLMAALGAFVGPPMIVATFFYFCIVNAIYSIGALTIAFPWGQAGLLYASKDVKVLNLEHFNEVRKKAIPFGPFILGGLIMAVLLKGPTLSFMGFSSAPH